MTAEADLKTRIAESGFFDPDWYLDRYPDVRASGLDPLDHFVRFGGLLRRDPSPLFDTAFYTDSYARDLPNGTHPLVDFLDRGALAGRLPTPLPERIAVVVHAFHLDVLGDLCSYLAHLTNDADQYVTYPDHFGSEERGYIAERFPKAQLLPVRNAGQDVGALLALSRVVDFSTYDVVLKLHTKKGQRSPVRWRHGLLRGVLGSTSQVRDTLAAFRRDRHLILSGARQLYLHGPSNLWGNADNISSTFSELIGTFDFQSAPWGFIAGTMFWMRGQTLSEVLLVLGSTHFAPGGYVDDGTPAHAAERMFGLIATLQGGRVRLCDIETPETAALAGPGYPAGLPGQRQLIGNLLEKVALPEDVLTPRPLDGQLDLDTAHRCLTGWIGQPDQSIARRARLTSGTWSVVLTADRPVAGLAERGFASARHGFAVPVPPELVTGHTYRFELIDENTGQTLAEVKGALRRPQRSYTTFQGFLAASMTQPVIGAPFAEEDKRAFAVMEGIASRYARIGLDLDPRPGVSVILRADGPLDAARAALESVQSQTFPAAEILVIASDEVAQALEPSEAGDRVIRVPQSGDPVADLSAALYRAGGDLIAHLDAVQSWDPRYLAAIAGAFAELPDIDAVQSGHLLYVKEAARPQAAIYGHANHALGENRPYLNMSSIAHRRAVIEQIGGPDPAAGSDLEDSCQDFVQRLAETGRLAAVPVILSQRRDSAAAVSAMLAPPTGEAGATPAGWASRLDARRAAMAADAPMLAQPVTVIVPNWQSLEPLRACLDALTDPLLTVIVVDNGSDRVVVDDLAAREKAGALTLISLDRNFGFTHAVNRGLEVAEAGQDILLLNNDAVVDPGAIAALQRAAQSIPNAGITVPRQILPPGTPTIRTHVPFADPNRPCDVNLSAHHRNVDDVPLHHAGGPMAVNFAPFFCAYVRRRVIDALGPLDAAHGRHYRSDRVYVDLMHGVTKDRLFYVPEARVTHLLQVATNQLRTDDDGKAFDVMFRKNRWDDVADAGLGYERAAWDDD